MNIFSRLKVGGVFALLWPFPVQQQVIEEKLPGSVKREIAGKRLVFYPIEDTDEVISKALSVVAFLAFSGVVQEVGGWQAVSNSVKSVCYHAPLLITILIRIS